MRIALDAMGGDRAPGATVEGARTAVELGYVRPGEVVLVGRPEDLRAEFGDAEYRVVERREDLPDPGDAAFVVWPAPEVIAMDERPAHALRQKPRASLPVAVRLVADGIADAVCSAGNTGATVAAAMLYLRRLPGVQRPGIAVIVEGEKGPITLIDVGANVFPKPIHLLQYGVMGASLVRARYGKQNPRVGLINIGGEEGKGNELAKETQRLFRSCPLEFVGNVEGQDVFLGAADVIVAEGFVGNVILKLSEGLATHILHVVQEELVRAGIRPEVLRTGLARILQRTDYAEYGGALLLGVEGVVTIGHGRSGPRAIANAVRVAKQALEIDVNEAIVRDLARVATTQPGS